MIDAGHDDPSYWNHPPNLNGLSSDELLDLPDAAFLHYMAASRAFRETIYGVSAARAMAHPKRFGNGRVLDFGCGVGYDAVSLAERGWVVSLCDLHRLNRAVAARWLGELGYYSQHYQVDIDELSMVGDFSLVHSYGVLHHIPDVEPVMRRLQDAVAPGGMLFLMLYTESFVPKLNERSDGKREGPYTRGYSLDETKALLGEGWTITRTEVWNQNKYRAITAMRTSELPK